MTTSDQPALIDEQQRETFKRLGLGLGAFSIGLGVFELFAAKRIGAALEANGHEGLIRGFGVREVVAGLNLIAAPAHSAGVWARVAGDAMDLAALAAAARNAPANRSVWAAIAFVLGATALDVFTARGLDATTGRLLPA